jgi:hypothetical protein
MSDSFQTEYTSEAEWSARHNISQRTTARYRQLPNGLPFLVFGGRIYIPNREGDDWIRSRIRRPNRPRGRPRKFEAAGLSTETAVAT